MTAFPRQFESDTRGIHEGLQSSFHRVSASETGSPNIEIDENPRQMQCPLQNNGGFDVLQSDSR